MIALPFAWFAAASFAASLLYFVYCYLVVYGESASSGSPWTAALVNLALFSAFACHHSVFARSGVKRWLHAVIPSTLERATYTLAASILFALVCAAWMPVQGALYHIPEPWTFVPYGVFGLGVAVTLLSARRLDALELAGVRQVLERGGATKRPAAPLLTTGLYGVVRHPIYLGWVLLMAGVPQMTFTRLTFAAISTIYLALAIPFEEKSLIETFGPDYASYQRKVRWRMLPGVY